MGDQEVLVLTRRKEETIIIGDSIEITVLGIRGEQVRLGISAPPEVPVHRKEIYETLAGQARGHSIWNRVTGVFIRAFGSRAEVSRNAGTIRRRESRENSRARQSDNRDRPSAA